MAWHQDTVPEDGLIEAIVVTALMLQSDLAALVLPLCLLEPLQASSSS